MKAWWKIGDKPRGMWRPLFEWGVHISAPVGAEIENLNVDTAVRYCLRGGADPHPPCGNKERGEERIMAFFPRVRLHRVSTNAHTGNSDGVIGSCGACSRSCPGGDIDSNNSWHCRGERTKDELLKWQVRLPWRPGARPDYSEFLDPVREFLRRVLEELERRLAEARESASSEEWLLKEEFDSFSMRTSENGVDVAERKLRVIRR